MADRRLARALVCVALAGAAALAAAAPAAAGAAPRLRGVALTPAGLARGTVFPIRDRVLRGARAAVYGLPGVGGRYREPDGAAPRIVQGPAFVPDDALRRSVADFFYGLYHGYELHYLTVYLATAPQVADACGDGADSCYDPVDDLIVLLDQPGASPTPIEQLAAHEYGHHIAAYRVSPFGNALDWGPERWASNANVCRRVARGTAFPGDEGDYYALDPGEAWAETNRILDTGAKDWPIIDPSFYPDARALALARQDILDPWQGDVVRVTRGAFRRGGAARLRVSVPLGGDGYVGVRLTPAPRLAVDLVLRDGRGHELARATGAAGRPVRLNARVCGAGERVRLTAYRHSGAGGFRLRVSRP